MMVSRDHLNKNAYVTIRSVDVLELMDERDALEDKCLNEMSDRIRELEDERDALQNKLKGQEVWIEKSVDHNQKAWNRVRELEAALELIEEKPWYGSAEAARQIARTALRGGEESNNV
jgi:predicted nuclease with TOPRIM domain